MDVGTLENSVSPIGFQWYAAQTRTSKKVKDVQAVDKSQPSQAVFLCSVCNDNSNLCWYDGQCVNGTCQCSIDSYGALCQIPPLGNGRCDEFYNTAEFFYDEGDCCESTCVSADYQCGKDISGFVHVGYPTCELDLGDWSLTANVIRGEALSGFSVGLSGNGRFLAIGEPGQDRVRLYDRKGSEWIERESILRGAVASQFGSSIALSRGVLNVVNNPSSIAPMMVAVGQPSGLVRVFHCTIDGCQRMGATLRAGRGDNSEFDIALDLSNDGRVAAMSKKSSSSTSTSSNPVLVYDLMMNKNRWVERTPRLPTMGAVYAVSLSGTGDMLGVGWESEENRSATHQTYAWNGTFWNLHGNAIVYSNSNSTDDNNTEMSDLIVHHGQSMVVSDDGNVLAIARSVWYGGNSGIEVFVWENMDWVQRGSTIKSGVFSLGGWAIALSADGSVVGIATGRESGGKDKLVRVFRWNSDKWIAQGEPMTGGPECAIDLSLDGHTVAIGLPIGENGGKGRTYVYEYPREKKCSNDASSVFHFSLTMDEFPMDISWDILNWNTSQILLKGGTYDDVYVNSTFADEVCVETNGCTIFTVYNKIGLDFARRHWNEVPMEDDDHDHLPVDYTLFMDGKEITNNDNNNNDHNHHRMWDFNYFPHFQRVYTGSCPICPDADGSTRGVFRMILTTCIPVSWEFLDRSGREIFSNDNANDFPVVDVNGGDNHTIIDSACMDRNDRTYWEEVCLPVDTCGTFSLFSLPKSIFATWSDVLPPEETTKTENIFNNNTTEGGVFLEERHDDVMLQDGINLEYLLLFDTVELSHGAEAVSFDAEEPLVSVNVGRCF